MTYDGNKVVSIDDGTSKRKFIYDGNFIVKQLKFNVDSQGKETKVRETTYTYSNGRLTSKISRVSFSESEPNGADFVKCDYTHNPDGTISCISYMPNSTEIDYTGILIYKENNLIKRDIDVVSIPDYGHEVDIYEYDTRNNPFKNILGFNLILQEINGYGSNNVIKLTRTIKNTPFYIVHKANYLYNDSNYPIKDNSVSNISQQEGEYTLDIKYTY
ncbi:hypothetical protein [Flavobacterium sp. LC2016-12]|uniref:hypothetical protein n=1 Tax=Flavobacterium sp. LC2016-12 TaxID=2783794 RepID=UPI00188D17D6|nr:hypothetical protein [Flavobacterium sp. LC2016-12]MBF4466788.1 hypothetical protein [Flavobacterium sp. LC2016-12]